MSNAVSVFRRLGGFRLLGAWLKLGILGKVFKHFCRGLLKGKSIRYIYSDTQIDAGQAIRARYRPLMVPGLSAYSDANLEKKRSDIVWVCWLQGMENAPDVVQVCYSSLMQNLVGKEIRVVDDKNRRQYVQLPEYIEERWRKKQIPPAHFSDLLRLELLIRYGGTWIDSTVLCTGSDYPKDFLDSDLFFFQYKRQASAPFAGISNWFITACSNNPLLMTLRDMLFAYWKDFRCLPAYFNFHLFFGMIAEERPDEVMAMPYGFSPECHVLQRHWGKPFDQVKWDKLLARVKFHKLTYRRESELASTPGNFYHHVIEKFGFPR